MLTIVLRARAMDLGRLTGAADTPVGATRWDGVPPHRVNACYDPQQNALLLPAAILQPPLCSADTAAAALFGGLRAVVAHEMTHGFDGTGMCISMHMAWCMARAWHAHGNAHSDVYGAYMAYARHTHGMHHACAMHAPRHRRRGTGHFYDERGAVGDGWAVADAREFERRIVEQAARDQRDSSEKAVRNQRDRSKIGHRPTLLPHFAAPRVSLGVCAMYAPCILYTPCARQVEQASRYRLHGQLDGQQLDGRRLCCENLADLGGVRLSHAALLETLCAGGLLDSARWWRVERQFFSEWARLWRERCGKARALQRLAVGTHAPSKARARR